MDIDELMKPGLVDIFEGHEEEVEQCLQAMDRLDRRTGCGMHLSGSISRRPEINTRHVIEDHSFPNLVIKHTSGRWKCCASIYIDDEHHYHAGWGDTPLKAMINGIGKMPMVVDELTTELHYWLKEERERLSGKCPVCGLGEAYSKVDDPDDIICDNEDCIQYGVIT